MLLYTSVWLHAAGFLLLQTTLELHAPAAERPSVRFSPTPRALSSVGKLGVAHLLPLAERIPFCGVRLPRADEGPQIHDACLPELCDATRPPLLSSVRCRALDLQIRWNLHPRCFVVTLRTASDPALEGLRPGAEHNAQRIGQASRVTLKTERVRQRSGRACCTSSV